MACRGGGVVLLVALAASLTDRGARGVGLGDAAAAAPSPRGPWRADSCPLAPLRGNWVFHVDGSGSGAADCLASDFYMCFALGFSPGDKVTLNLAQVLKAKASGRGPALEECCNGTGIIALSEDSPQAEFHERTFSFYDGAAEVGHMQAAIDAPPSWFAPVEAPQDPWDTWWTCETVCPDLHRVVAVSRRQTWFWRPGSRDSPPRSRVYADLDPLPGSRPPCCDGPLYRKEYKYVLFLYTEPEGDHNLVFGMAPKLCARIKCWAEARGFDVVMRHVGSVAAALEEIRKFPRRSLHHVIIGGHGEQSTLMLGCDRLKCHFNVGGFFEELRERTRLTASVTLESCNTAAGEYEDNLFAEASRKLPGRRVLASTTWLTDDMWHLEKQDGPSCVTSDLAILRDRGQKAFAIAEGGQPPCSEFDAEDAQGHVGGLCWSDCLQPCHAVQQDFRSRGLITDSISVERAGISAVRLEDCGEVPITVVESLGYDPFDDLRSVCRLTAGTDRPAPA